MKRSAVARAGEKFGPYELVHQVAIGGMAEIYLARARGVSGFEKYVALKMIHPDRSSDRHFVDMLVEEAKIAVNLTHGNIVQIFDLGRIGPVYYIAMEFIDGLDLFHIMRNVSEVREKVDFGVATFLLKEVCAGLDYAHSSRDSSGQPLHLVHRDISPQNILVSRSGEVKVADFGIAKAAKRARQTAVGIIKGKYYYMSPEQAWGDPIDRRSDIFSAGVVLYEVIVGQMLYLEEDISSLLDRVRKADIAPPRTLRSDVPPALEEIVMRALAKRPEERYQSAHDFHAALAKFLYQSAPEFTVQRVRELVERALVLEAARSAEDTQKDATPVSLIELESREHHSLPGGTLDVAPSELMDADEFTSLTSHSLIVGPGASGLSGTVDDDSLGDSTLVSGPKRRVSAQEAGIPMTHDPGAPTRRARRAGAPSRPAGGEASWDDEAPTRRKDAAGVPQQPLPGTRTPIYQSPSGWPQGGPPDEGQRAVYVYDPAIEQGRTAWDDPAHSQQLTRPKEPKRLFGAISLPAHGPRRNLVLGGIVACVFLLGLAALLITQRSCGSKEGAVELKSVPSGARVYYRDQLIGRTPVKLDKLALDETHKVRLEADGCDPLEVTLALSPGETKTVSVELPGCDAP